MENSDTEANRTGVLLLRREARKQLGSRVPVALSIGIALLTGALFGYGLRAFIAERDAAPAVCPARHRPRIVLPPPAANDGSSKPRIILLDTADPDRADPPAAPAAPAAVPAAALD